MKKQRVLVLALLAAAFAAGVTAQEETTYDVPFVPTPEEVVNSMLKLANVGKDDVLYDLGCGDGRIVVTAVKKFGARGIGIDIDPRRIEESKATAAKAEVTDRIQFKQENLFETDFSEASVLTLYLLSSVNLKLRPTILNKLKPGARVVSHDFSMGEWEPDQLSWKPTVSITMCISGLFPQTLRVSGNGLCPKARTAANAL
jgi:ubiquinone/menaquinone biosynthesis C-methylase UbiE